MQEITSNASLVARCGLYCGACGQYLKGKCPGCAKNEKATWCGIRSCTAQHGWSSCAECTSFSNVKDCKKFNNLMSKVFGLIFRSNRAACIDRIREVGPAQFAAERAGARRQSM